MAKLYSYCIPVDDGAAPNPFWGICTLVICKPVIRRTAEVGDWIVGTGSVKSPVGDIGGRVVYAMRVSRKMTMQEYDQYTQEHLPNKIPDWNHRDIRRHLGDSIYDFSTDPPKIRQSVHSEKNQARDLRGKYALLSDHFFYFGNKPVKLPDKLLPIVKQSPGHRSRANDEHLSCFLDWLCSQDFRVNCLYGKPQYKIFKDNCVSSGC